jgi:hypothetical protein
MLPRMGNTLGTFVLPALGGAVVGLVGLTFVDRVDPWSWVVAPLVLAAGAVAQVRALTAEGGPFRT